MFKEVKPGRYYVHWNVESVHNRPVCQCCTLLPHRQCQTSCSALLLLLLLADGDHCADVHACLRRRRRLCLWWYLQSYLPSTSASGGPPIREGSIPAWRTASPRRTRGRRQVPDQRPKKEGARWKKSLKRQILKCIRR